MMVTIFSQSVIRKDIINKKTLSLEGFIGDTVFY